MINLDECKDRCFATVLGECTVMDFPNDTCDSSCPFYKPVGCKDWIRLNIKGVNVIVAPEENERRFGSEKDRKRRSLYWQVKRVPKG